MKFTNKLPNLGLVSNRTSKQVNISKKLENTMLQMEKESGLPREYNSLTARLSDSVFRYPSNSFSLDKDVLFRRLLSSTSPAGAQNILDFPQLLTVLPAEAKDADNV